MSYLDVSGQNEDEKSPDLQTGESVDKSHFDQSMSRSPLFKISDLKNLKMKELEKASKQIKREDNDPEHHGDKYLGQYYEPSKSSRSNVSKIAKSKVDTLTYSKSPNKIKSLKGLPDEED
jgi:hypothetical protein